MTDIDYLKKYLDPSKLEEGLKRLEQGEPVQYIVGNVDFYGYNFIVNKNVLIPRFETEQLVEKTINYVKSNKKLDIIDLGCGSGCIAITLKKELNCNMDAVDVSKSALEVAKQNALNNNVKINFIEDDMIKSLTKKYDVIISNPPYIAHNEEIMDIVKKNEPHIALYADDNGLYYYKEIIKKANNYLNDNGLLAFEIGYQQGKDLEEFAKKYFSNVKVEKDLSGKDRFLFIKK